MQKRLLGQSAIEITRLGLGCMGMSEFYGDADESESVATLNRALDLGINFFDTADMYGIGRNEELVGRILGPRRTDVVIATKFGFVRKLEDVSFRGVSGKPEYVRSACDASLKRLGINTIDLYYQHRVDPEVPIEDTVGAMKELIDAGKVRALGLSEASAATIRRAHAVHPISALQSEFSLWSRDVEAEIIPTCLELGITFVAYSPLGRGFLTGGIKSPADFADDDVRRNWPRFQGENFQKNLDLVHQVETIAKEKNATVAQLALAWVMAQYPEIVPIPGTTKVHRLEENVGSLNLTLSADDLARIEAVMPADSIAGDRYHPAGMQMINQ